MGGRTGRGEQVRSSPCIKLKAGVLLQLSCLTTARDRCAEQEWCHHCSRRNKRVCQGLAPDGSSASPRADPPGTGAVSLFWRCQPAPGDPGGPGPAWGRVERPGFVPAQAGARPGQDSGTPRSRAGGGQSRRPAKLLLGSASLGTFPVVTAPALEGLPEPKHSRRRSPPPPDIDSRGGSRS